MTEAELYDHLQRTFGIGDWDERTSEVPWWKFRGTEIAKLKSMMKRRGASVVQVLTAADYAMRTRKPIKATYQLFELIPEAMAASRQQLQTDRKVELARGINESVAEALELGEDEWAAVLMRAQVSEAQAVINQWRNR